MERLELEIRPLSPALAGDWLQFFDTAAFADHKEWAFCYCLEGFLDPETQENWTDAAARRERAAELIQGGEMQGYLAYAGGAVVGWCNANDRENYKYLTEVFKRVGYRPEYAPDAGVKSVFCFLISPGCRGQGVAQQLLHRVCADAAAQGYGCVEAYPFADRGFAYQYHGSVGMYARNGFLEIADLVQVKVMRRYLKG